MFLQGGDPSPYIQPLSISLFLSANQEDVHRAVQQGYPAGQVLNSSYEDAYDDQPIRVAFDNLEEAKRPASEDPSFVELWRTSGGEEEMVQRVVQRWRSQGT